MRKIENDCYFICQRLKEIDPSYEVFYNNGHFEVHSFEQIKNSYCFTVPFDKLDSRTIDYALKTRSNNRDKIIAEIEKNNQLVYENYIKNTVNLLKEGLCL